MEKRKDVLGVASSIKGETMRSHLVVGGFALAVLLAACGSPAATATTSANTCVGESPGHRAYVVVEHLSGVRLQQCVPFSGDTIDGQALMNKSGVEYRARSLSSGMVVCQVDNEPRALDQCSSQNQLYWALFVDVGGVWSRAPNGYTSVRLHSGDALGWHYVRASDPAPAPPPLSRSV